MTALILGVAAMAWFGWGQDQPPAGWPLPLIIGTSVSFVIAAAAGLTAVRFRHEPAAMRDRRVRRAYGITVGVEVVACLAGARVLTMTGQARYVAPWILLVVGVHLLPLARIFKDSLMIPAGVILSVIAIAGAVTGAVSDVTPSAVTGAFGGLTCLACSVACLRRSLLRGSGKPAGTGLDAGD